MKFLTPLLVLGFAAAQTPDEEAIRIRSVRYAGSGCPQDSVSVSVSSDMEFITLGFDKFTPFIGPGNVLSDRIKACRVELVFEPSENSRFAVTASTYHGHVRLDAGVRKTFSSTFFFSQVDGPITTTQVVIEGGGAWAQGQVFTGTEQVAPEDYIQSPCSYPGSPIYMEVIDRVILQSTNSSISAVIPDDEDVPFTQQIRLVYVYSLCP
ncbi:hypothetical protein MMYC01_209940 [Madurella mycetomatis]|uniref:Secreted protein n=1 Tax=Madurella mycetomatis TaxID=100816 RepID=A0A175VSA0_9PEZI|nr:hypothetical protein MMYC01_209940 [Madurella mycetomatis]